MNDIGQIRSFEPMSDSTGQRIASALERIATILEKDLFSEKDTNYFQGMAELPGEKAKVAR